MRERIHPRFGGSARGYLEGNGVVGIDLLPPGSVQEAVALHGRCLSIQNGKPAEHNQERQISHGDIIQFLMHERRSREPMARSVNIKQFLPAPPIDFFEKKPPFTLAESTLMPNERAGENS